MLKSRKKIKFIRLIYNLIKKLWKIIFKNNIILNDEKKKIIPINNIL